MISDLLLMLSHVISSMLSYLLRAYRPTLVTMMSTPIKRKLAAQTSRKSHLTASGR